MKKSLLIVLGVVSAIGSTAFAATPISPVVQVRTYDAIQGKYPQELRDGSASIISKNGLLVTNNHVAQNSDEENALGYIICFTMSQGATPECNYTAHVIMRNPDLDMALLQLDKKDINGNQIDFSSLPVLDIDYSYIPVDSDKVQAIGYPGIGGDTLTTTNGTVAGTIKYNGFTYIKTDATIAPGNSGGPMISAAGKQIGLNTFGISSDAESLGYGLLMKDAKSFIDEYKDKTPEVSLNDVDLGSYAKKIDQINKQNKIIFPWISYTIPAGYEIKNAIDGIGFVQVPKDQKDVQASMVRVGISKTPTIDNEKAFFYYLEANGIYSKKYTKLVPTTISGKKFYKIVFSWDETAGEGGGTQVYIGQLNKNAIVHIIMDIDGAGEKKLTDVKNEKDLIIKNIQFVDDTYQPVFDGVIPDPSIVFTKPDSWVGDSVVLGSDSSILSLTTYVNNLHDGINISVGKTTKATSVQKLYNNELKDTAKNMKSLGKLQGNDAFIACSENGGGSYGSPDVDENNKPLQQFLCTITAIIYSIDKVPYRIDIQIAGPRNAKETFLQTMISRIDKEVILGHGKTTLPNIFKKGTTAGYSDLRDQTTAYKKKIDTLIGYNLLKKTSTFGAYTPITYGLLAEKYLLMVHNINISNATCKTTICLLQTKTVQVQNKQVSLYDLFSDVKINWNGYVEQEKAEQFLFYMKLKLAGVILPMYSEEILNEIATDPENTEYTSIYAAIDAYNANLYGSKKIGYNEVLGDDYGGYYKSFFKPTKMVEYIPKKGILTTSYFSDKPIVFDDTNISKINCEYIDLKSTCKTSKTDNILGSFIVLDKGTMIDMLVQDMDFGLFDPELAKKKEADIDESAPLDTDAK